MLPAIAGGLLSGAGALLGNIVGGLFGQSGARDANRTSIQMAREQMAFQERMSNTSYARAVEDMKRAGLNPMLAYQQGGASSPSGAQPGQILNEKESLGRGMSQGITSALQAVSTKAAVEKMVADTRSVEETTRGMKIDNDIKAKYSANNASYNQQIIQEQLNQAKNTTDMLKVDRDNKEKQKKLELDILDLQKKALEYGGAGEAAKQMNEFFKDAPEWLKGMEWFVNLFRHYF